MGDGSKALSDASTSPNKSTHRTDEDECAKVLDESTTTSMDSMHDTSSAHAAAIVPSSTSAANGHTDDDDEAMQSDDSKAPAVQIVVTRRNASLRSILSKHRCAASDAGRIGHGKALTFQLAEGAPAQPLSPLNCTLSPIPFPQTPRKQPSSPAVAMTLPPSAVRIKAHRLTSPQQLLNIASSRRIPSRYVLSMEKVFASMPKPMETEAQPPPPPPTSTAAPPVAVAPADAAEHATAPAPSPAPAAAPTHAHAHTSSRARLLLSRATALIAQDAPTTSSSASSGVCLSLTQHFKPSSHDKGTGAYTPEHRHIIQTKKYAPLQFRGSAVSSSPSSAGQGTPSVHDLQTIKKSQRVQVLFHNEFMRREQRRHVELLQLAQSGVSSPPVCDAPALSSADPALADEQPLRDTDEPLQQQEAHETHVVTMSI